MCQGSGGATNRLGLLLVYFRVINPWCPLQRPFWSRSLFTNVRVLARISVLGNCNRTGEGRAAELPTGT